MKKRTILFIVFAVLITLIGLFVYREYNRENENLSQTSADVEVTAAKLIADFEANDSAANVLYRNKILLVKGIVKNFDTVAGTRTIVLGDSLSMSSVRCLLESGAPALTAGFSVGQPIQIKGAITGFKKDDLGIGADVELNRCVVVE
jgi:hypothetical protein